MSTHVIPSANMSELSERIDKLNKICSKLAIAPIALTTISDSVVELKEKNPPYAGTGYYITLYTVEITGESPIVNGWAFVAALEHSEAGNIIRNISGSELPIEYRNAPPACDHCGMTRNRANTYVLVNSDGQYKQVGSSCLRDFLGHADPHMLAEYLESLHHLTDDMGNYDPDYSGNSEHTLINVSRFVALTAAVVHKFGWMGKGKALEQGVTSTCERAIDNYHPSVYLSADNRVEVTEDDKVLADNAIAWASHLEGKSEYEYNLSVICSDEYTKPRNLGILASVIVAYRKAQGESSTGKRISESEHIGQVGDKITLKVIVKRISEIDGAYGLTSVVGMVSGDDELVWFASGRTVLEEGKEYQIKGTVKAHNLYNGVKQTALTRCKVL